ncbi:DUF3626 domain-containing protein [Actinoplanes auranticolor]|uniref:DUF3626 domain-containing protein n=1 Tax=Actinoplanes auranticolor TaxID=47988 RepID=UPI001BB3D0C8|nr:DUF3626 domain-containing protein [Actinoplanes auranticolor]
MTVSFHPDRLLADGRTVAEHLARDGVYRHLLWRDRSAARLTSRELSHAAAAASRRTVRRWSAAADDLHPVRR